MIFEDFGKLPWVLPPVSNSWKIVIIGLYIALNRTPNIDCYWVGAVPKNYHKSRSKMIKVSGCQAAGCWRIEL